MSVGLTGKCIRDSVNSVDNRFPFPWQLIIISLVEWRMRYYIIDSWFTQLAAVLPFDGSCHQRHHFSYRKVMTSRLHVFVFVSWTRAEIDREPGGKIAPDFLDVPVSSDWLSDRLTDWLARSSFATVIYIFVMEFVKNQGIFTLGEHR